MSYDTSVPIKLQERIKSFAEYVQENNFDNTGAELHVIPSINEIEGVARSSYLPFQDGGLRVDPMGIVFNRTKEDMEREKRVNPNRENIVVTVKKKDNKNDQ